MIEIRDGIIEDAEEIGRLAVQLGYERLAVIETTNKLKALIESDKDRVFVACQDGKLIGWIHFFLAMRLGSPDFWEIGGLVVDSEFRGMGVGKNLIEHLKEANIDKVRVRSNEKRAETIHFYKACGFVEAKSQAVLEKRL